MNTNTKKKLSSFIRAITLASMVLLSSAGAMAGTSNLPAKVDAFIDKLDEKINALPGVSIAIVQNDQVLLTEGYGVVDVNTKEPFTKDTYSYIASGTKAIVGLAIATLAERGEIDLDAPIGCTYLSDMNQEKLGLFATVTFRQLLTHTHGLDGGSIGFRTAFTGDVNSDIIWNLLGQVSESKEGTVFNYSNFGYVATSYVLEHIYNETWQKIVERTVVSPSGMNSTTFQVSNLVGRSVAMPHQWMGSANRVPLFKRDNTMHAGGGQFSTANDLSRWLELNLNEGVIDGEQVLPASAVTLAQAPLATLDEEFYAFKRVAYGLGWYRSDYEGVELLHHLGAFTGYRSHVSIMPSIGLGVAVLTNDAGPATFNLPDMIATYIYDIALGKEGVEEKFDAELVILAERIAPFVDRTGPIRPRNTPDNEPEYAGVYKNDQWGVWELRENNGLLQLHWGNAISDLIYVEKDGDTLMRIEISGRGYFAHPQWTDDGKISAFTFRGIKFERQ